MSSTTAQINEGWKHIAKQREIVQCIGDIGDARAIDHLAMAIEDDSQNHLHSFQINALGRIDDPRVVQLLIKALKKPKICYDAANSLGLLGDKRAIEPLVNMLVSNTGLPVVHALERLNWKPETDEHQVAFLIAKRDWESFTRLPSNMKELAVEPLVRKWHLL